MASLQEVGQRLKQAREAQGLSLSEISVRTRITVRHLKALEEGAEGELPEVFYIRGFLKKYAEVVGLSPADVADAYRSAPVPTAPLPDLRQGTGRWGYYVLIAALLVGLLGLAWYFQPRVSVVEAPPVAASPDGTDATASPPSSSPESTPAASPALALSPEPSVVVAASSAASATEAPSPVASPASSPAESVKPASPSASPAAEVKPSPLPSASPTAEAKPSARPSATPSPAATAKRQVSVGLKWVGRSWVEVQVDGKLVLEGILTAGSSKQFTGREIEVSAGNAGGVKVVVDGRDQGLFGRYGEVTTRVYRAKP